MKPATTRIHGPDIYLVGVAGPAKTALAKDLDMYFLKGSESGDDAEIPWYPPDLISKAADKILGEQKNRIASSQTRPIEPYIVRAIQNSILLAQHSAEREALSMGGLSWLVCDGSGVEPIVYLERYAPDETPGARGLADTEVWLELRDQMRESLVVVTEELVGSSEAARWRSEALGTDEDRSGLSGLAEDLKDLAGFHGAVREFLERQGIGFVVFPAELKGSRDAVMWVVETWKEKKATSH